MAAERRRDSPFKKSINMQIGTILNWNEEKGFGFITPKSGDKNIFAHINDYSRLHKHPFKGLEVQYILSVIWKPLKDFLIRIIS